MARTLKTAGIALTAAVTLLAAIPAAHAQMGKKGSHAAPSTDTKPKVDEKAYKAALDRIPDPDRKYDPWGVVRPSEPASAGRK